MKHGQDVLIATSQAWWGRHRLPNRHDAGRDLDRIRGGPAPPRPQPETAAWMTERGWGGGTVTQRGLRLDRRLGQG